MTSAIDATKPVAGNPTTQSVRDNFATAKSEITALQAVLPTLTANAVLVGNGAGPIVSSAITSDNGSTLRVSTNQVIGNAVTSPPVHSLTINNAASTPQVGFGLGLLNVVADGGPTNVTLDNYSTANINFVGRRARGTAAAPSAVQATDNLLIVGGQGYGASGYSSNYRGSLTFQASQNWTDTAQGTQVVLSATPSGSIIPTTVATFQQGMQIGAPAGGDLGAGTLNMAGKLGINFNAVAAPAPAYSGNLVVHGVDAAANATSFEMISYGANPSIPRFLGRHAGGSGASPAATPAGANLGAFCAGGYGTAWVTPTGVIQFLNAEAGAWTAAANGTSCQFYLTPIGATAPALVAMLQAGMQLGTPTGGDKGVGTLNATGVYANNVLLTSDAQLKTDIRALPSCLGLVAGIEPKRFKFRDPGPTKSTDPDSGPTPSGPPGWFDKMRWGFVAQDVEKAMTGHDFGGVEKGADGMRSLSHSDLLAVLWQAVREMSVDLAELKGKEIEPQPKR